MLDFDKFEAKKLDKIRSDAEDTNFGCTDSKSSACNYFAYISATLLYLISNQFFIFATLFYLISNQNQIFLIKHHCIKICVLYRCATFVADKLKLKLKLVKI